MKVHSSLKRYHKECKRPERGRGQSGVAAFSEGYKRRNLGNTYSEFCIPWIFAMS